LNDKKLMHQSLYHWKCPVLESKLIVGHQMNFHVHNNKEDKISKPVDTSRVEAMARVSMQGRKHAHQGSYIFPPNFKGKPSTKFNHKTFPFHIFHCIKIVTTCE
jgi:hypothetical protein